MTRAETGGANHLSRFASAEGKEGAARFYTPTHVVRVLVENARALLIGRTRGPGLRPLLRLGRDVRADREVHRGARGPHLAIRGIDAQIGHGDTLHNGRVPDLKADYVLTTPPFNDSDWRGEVLKDDQRWTGSRTMTRGFDA